MTRRTLLASLPLASVLQAASPRNWPHFRGPGARGVSDDDARLPERWSTTENIAWKMPMPGLGWASPIVSGDRVFVTTAVSEEQIGEIKKGFYNSSEDP